MAEWKTEREQTKELRAELSRRNLETTGKKAEL